MSAGWRPIPGFPGYEASSAGEIRPVQPRYKVSAVELWLAELVGERIVKRGQVLKPWIVLRHNREAAYVTLHIDGQDHKELVHRLVCLAFEGLPPPGMDDCAHQNHNSLDNRASNLNWSSHADNVAANYDRDEANRERSAMMEETIAEFISPRASYAKYPNATPF
jgi:hypothetical protein